MAFERSFYFFRNGPSIFCGFHSLTSGFFSILRSNIIGDADKYEFSCLACKKECGNNTLHVETAKYRKALSEKV